MRTKTVRFAGRDLPLPASKTLRVVLGVLLVLGGLVGFLPVLGFWMAPLGLLVLSVDLPIARRWRRGLQVKWQKWRLGETGRSRRHGAGDKGRASAPYQSLAPTAGAGPFRGRGENRKK